MDKQTAETTTTTGEITRPGTPGLASYYDAYQGLTAVNPLASFFEPDIGMSGKPSPGGHA
jgi:hypothetical protein